MNGPIHVRLSALIFRFLKECWQRKGSVCHRTEIPLYKAEVFHPFQTCSVKRYNTVPKEPEWGCTNMKRGVTDCDFHFVRM